LEEFGVGPIPDGWCEHGGVADDDVGSPDLFGLLGIHELSVGVQDE
jgi:hypothetical protein